MDDDVRRLALPLRRTSDLDPLLDRIGGARHVVPRGPRARPSERRDHRAIGVVDDPGSERWGSDVPTVLGRRYVAFCWSRDSRALELAGDGGPPVGELPTWPEDR